MKKFTKQELLDATIDATRKTHIYKNLGYKSVSGTTASKIKKLFEENNLDIDELINNNIYDTKICPVCSNEFRVSKQYETHRPKTTCSHSCSNTYFRSGINNGSHTKAVNTEKSINNNSHYRTICFHYHEKQCIVCGEQNIVAVHHYDENHYNNDPANLVPMCPTHHQYMHSNFKHLIEEQVEQYVLNWKKNNET